MLVSHAQAARLLAGSRLGCQYDAPRGANDARVHPPQHRPPPSHKWPFFSMADLCAAVSCVEWPSRRGHMSSTNSA